MNKNKEHKETKKSFDFLEFNRKNPDKSSTQRDEFIKWLKGKDKK